MRWLLLAVALSGCAARPSVIRCVPIVTYTPAQQATLALELPQDGPMTNRVVRDYDGLRAAEKACAAHK